MKLRPPHATILCITLLTIFFDQLSKWYLLFEVGMTSRPPIVVTDFFSLIMVWNKGISFGILNHPERSMPWLLIGLALAISAVLLRMALKTEKRWEAMRW